VSFEPDQVTRWSDKSVRTGNNDGKHETKQDEGVVEADPKIKKRASKNLKLKKVINHKKK